MMVLTAGILYGSQAWFPVVDKLSPAKAANETAAAMRDAAVGRKARPNDNPQSVTPRVKTNESENNRTQEERNKIAVTSTEKKAATMKSQDGARQAEEVKSGTSRKSLQRIGAPSIRFPKPDLRENSPAPSPVSRSRVYGYLFNPAEEALSRLVLTPD